MTIDYLKQYQSKAKLLAQLEQSYNALLSHTSPADNMPHAKGVTSDPVNTTAMMRLERRAEMEELRRDLVHRYDNIRKWLNSLHDPILEAYVLLHYCDGLSLKDVAEALNKDDKYINTIRIGTFYPYFRAHSDDTYTD